MNNLKLKRYHLSAIILPSNLNIVTIDSRRGTIKLKLKDIFTTMDVKIVC